VTTTTARLGLTVQDTADQFDTDHLIDNWEILEAAPGVYITTVSNEPTWGAAHNGMFLTYSDNGLTYRWTGAAFVRAFSKGWQGVGERTTDLTEATGSFTVLAQVTGVVVAGDRRTAITVSWSEITGDPVRFGIFRGSTQLTAWLTTTDGGSVTFFDNAAAGTYTYSFRVMTTDTSSTVECAADAPARIDVWEA
jgi:hypothetical protein